MLKPLTTLQEPEYGSDSPTVACENPNCTNQGPTHKMINFTIIIGSPGDETLPPMQCPAHQGPQALGHWSCSRECWLLVAHACVDEHGHEMLVQAHQSLSLGG
jgi:hypothetical protein